MKTITTKLRYFLICLLSIGAVLSVLPPTNAFAQCAEARFLTFPAWYNGLAEERDGGCEMKSPTEYGDGKLGTYIWRIALNIVEIMLNLVGYAAVAYIIYGGYKYMISTGSPDGMVGARKTIMNAAIGLIISIAAVAIIRTISNGLGAIG